MCVCMHVCLCVCVKLPLHVPHTIVRRLHGDGAQVMVVAVVADDRTPRAAIIITSPVRERVCAIYPIDTHVTSATRRNDRGWLAGCWLPDTICVGSVHVLCVMCVLFV